MIHQKYPIDLRDFRLRTFSISVYLLNPGELIF